MAGLNVLTPETGCSERYTKVIELAIVCIFNALCVLTSLNNRDYDMEGRALVRESMLHF